MKKSADRVVTLGFSDDFIKELAAHLLENHRAAGVDLGRTAVVFGGRRPALFLARELSRRVRRGFFPPSFFSMDEFVRYILEKKERAGDISGMDACRLVYELARDEAPAILRGRESFARFLPWAREIAAFIEDLDLEDVAPDALDGIGKSAAIGYDVPESVNMLLRRLKSLREGYHAAMMERGRYARGFAYLLASRAVREAEFPEFDRICFCNLFYLHATEAAIVEDLYDRGKAWLFFQRDERPWPALDRLSQRLSIPIRAPRRPPPSYRLHILEGFDSQSQAALVREVLKKIRRHDRTVIVLPEPASVVPLLSEIAVCARDLNVSMGYQIAMSALYGLFECVVRAQESKREDGYYARDYLSVLTHPLVKTMKIALEPAVTRVLAHKVEEALSGEEETTLSGSLFVKLDEVEGLGVLHRLAAGTLSQMGIELDAGEIPSVLREVHELAFRMWERIGTFAEFSEAAERFLRALIERGSLGSHFINLRVVERLLAVSDELKSASFSGERFPPGEMFRIFMDSARREKLSFAGSPLKGLQVLGLFETRSLSFDRVIVMDVNESVLPRVRACEPLVPREVMVSLGVNRMEEEEEIQRYHFMRLISHAREVYLIYDGDPEKGRSRFIEELIWEKEKERGALGEVSVRRASFRARLAPKPRSAAKSSRIMDSLRAMTFSPSKADMYLECPLSFYFRHVLRLREKEDLLEEPEGGDVGVFIHGVLQKGFERFLGTRPRVDEAFRSEFLSLLKRRFAEEFGARMKSGAFLLEHVVRFRLERFLDAEADRPVEELLALEEWLQGDMTVKGRPMPFRCRIDRIDRLEGGRVMVIDYKTGSTDKVPRPRMLLGGGELSREWIRRAVRSFQLPLYYHFVRERYQGAGTTAALYNLQEPKLIRFPADKDSGQGEEIIRACMRALEYIIEEILDPETPFVADESDPRLCARCPYSRLCR